MSSIFNKRLNQEICWGANKMVQWVKALLPRRWLELDRTHFLGLSTRDIYTCTMTCTHTHNTRNKTTRPECFKSIKVKTSQRRHLTPSSGLHTHACVYTHVHKTQRHTYTHLQASVCIVLMIKIKIIFVSSSHIFVKDTLSFLAIKIQFLSLNVLSFSLWDRSERNSSHSVTDR